MIIVTESLKLKSLRSLMYKSLPSSWLFWAASEFPMSMKLDMLDNVKNPYKIASLITTRKINKDGYKSGLTLSCKANQKILWNYLMNFIKTVKFACPLHLRVDTTGFSWNAKDYPARQKTATPYAKRHMLKNVLPVC